MNNKKLETFSGFVSNICVKKKDGNYYQSGTALFIKHKEDYYAVTAKHCFINGSTQVGKTLPTIENTNEEAGFTNLNIFGEVTLLHKEKLHNGRVPLFNVFYTDEGQATAIDVAALKLTNPSNDVRSISIDSNCLDNSGAIFYHHNLAITGFPSYAEDKEDNIITNFESKEIQEILGKEHNYYFLMPSNKNLRVTSIAGFSGSAILDLNTKKIIGFVVGENKETNHIYGIYAKYMSELLN